MGAAKSRVARSVRTVMGAGYSEGGRIIGSFHSHQHLTRPIPSCTRPDRHRTFSTVRGGSRERYLGCYLDTDKSHFGYLAQTPIWKGDFTWSNLDMLHLECSFADRVSLTFVADLERSQMIAIPVRNLTSSITRHAKQDTYRTTSYDQLPKQCCTDL